MTDAGETKKTQGVSFREFLETCPPTRAMDVSDLYQNNPIISVNTITGFYKEITVPELELFCTDGRCNGSRMFRFMKGDRVVNNDQPIFTYFMYRCSNCRNNVKIYSLRIECAKDDGVGKALKFGELPIYGVPTPTRLLELFESEREIFLQGRRCENQGLGIGAFAYYRRVVEHQRNRIIDEILKVARLVNAPSETISALEAAKAETQFSNAMESIKDAVPQSLLLRGGHNPLTLLHSALSQGLHAETDEDCLAAARTMRLIMAELAERMGQALKDETELQTALSRLMQKKKTK